MAKQVTLVIEEQVLCQGRHSVVKGPARLLLRVTHCTPFDNPECKGSMTLLIPSRPLDWRRREAGDKRGDSGACSDLGLHAAMDLPSYPPLGARFGSSQRSKSGMISTRKPYQIRHPLAHQYRMIEEARVGGVGWWPLDINSWLSTTPGSLLRAHSST